MNVHAEKKRKRERDPTTFYVKGESALKALPYWLKEVGANTYSYSSHRQINVGYDYNPDSDWGKYEWRGKIIILDEKYFDGAEKVIGSTLWPDKGE